MTNYFKILILIIHFISINACVVKLRSPEEPQAPFYPIDLVSISSNQLLIKVIYDPSTGDTPALAGIFPAAGGDVPALGGVAPAAGGSTDALGGFASPLDSVETISGGATAVNSNTNYDAEISNIIASNEKSTCSVLPPYHSYSCQPNASFLFDSDDITFTSELKLQAQIPLTPLSIKSSLPIKTRFYRITQVSNTRNNNNSTDDAYLLSEYKNELYFNALNSNGRRKLFKTDGMTITQISDIRNNQSADDFHWQHKSVVLNDKLIFIATQASGGIKLFVYDGTDITQLSNIRNNQSLSDTYNHSFLPGTIDKLNGELYFQGININGRDKLYKTDGTTITQLGNTRNDNTLDDETANSIIFNFNNEIYFFSRNASERFKLYKTNGTTITQVSNSRNNQGSHDFDYNAYEFAVLNNELYIVLLNQSGRLKLYKTDGTTITQVSNTNATSDWPIELINYKNSIYFIAANSNDENKVYKTDGTQVVQFSNITNNQSLNDWIAPKIVYNDELYLNGIKLYKTDGEKLTQVANTRMNNSLSDNHTGGIIEFDNLLFFSALNENGVSKIFATDGVNVAQVSNTTQNNSTNDNPRGYKIFNNELYFTANNANGVGKVFKISIE